MKNKIVQKFDNKDYLLLWISGACIFILWVMLITKDLTELLYNLIKLNIIK